MKEEQTLAPPVPQGLGELLLLSHPQRQVEILNACWHSEWKSHDKRAMAMVAKCAKDKPECSELEESGEEWSLQPFSQPNAEKQMIRSEETESSEKYPPLEPPKRPSFGKASI